jgi:hypothetical protein
MLSWKLPKISLAVKEAAANDNDEDAELPDVNNVEIIGLGVAPKSMRGRRRDGTLRRFLSLSSECKLTAV